TGRRSAPGRRRRVESAPDPPAPAAPKPPPRQPRSTRLSSSHSPFASVRRAPPPCRGINHARRAGAVAALCVADKTPRTPRGRPATYINCLIKLVKGYVNRGRTNGRCALPCPLHLG